VPHLLENRSDVSAPSASLRLRSHGVELVGVLATGVGLAVVVAADGSPLWRVVRVLLVALVTLAAMAAVRYRSWTAAACGALGLVGTAIAIGFVVPHLTAGEVSVPVAGAAVALAAGVVLLARAAITIWHRARWIGRALFVLGAVAAAYVVGFPVVIAVAATNVPRAELAGVTPAGRGLVFVDADLRTSDGVALSAWYIPSRNGAAIAVFPGASSTRASALDQGVVLARHGYGVLLVDPRGMGRSAGRAMNLGWYGDQDVGAAVQYLVTRPDVDATRVGALGESMGGEEVLGAMAAEPRLRAVVAEGATNRVAADKAWLADVYGVRGWMQQRVDTLTYGLTDLLTAASPPRTLASSAASAAPRSVLLISAGNVAEEGHAHTAIKEKAGANVETWTVAGAAHTGGLRAQPDEWAARVTAFFDHALTPQ
jgi:dienelactone hydrolase